MANIVIHIEEVPNRCPECSYHLQCDKYSRSKSRPQDCPIFTYEDARKILYQNTEPDGPSSFETVLSKLNIKE